MAQQSEQRSARCPLCTNQVSRQGDVCKQCEPRYMALGQAIIEYARQLYPILAASPHKHIHAVMRFVGPNIQFFLQELAEPIDLERWRITHRLSILSLKPDRSLQTDDWYGHNIESAFMAATINRDVSMMGFPEEPEYFVPVSSWKNLDYPTRKPTGTETDGGGSNGPEQTEQPR